MKRREREREREDKEYFLTWLIAIAGSNSLASHLASSLCILHSLAPSSSIHTQGHKVLPREAELNSTSTRGAPCRPNLHVSLIFKQW